MDLGIRNVSIRLTTVLSLGGLLLAPVSASAAANAVGARASVSLVKSSVTLTQTSDTAWTLAKSGTQNATNSTVTWTVTATEGATTPGHLVQAASSEQQSTFTENAASGPLQFMDANTNSLFSLVPQVTIPPGRHRHAALLRLVQQRRAKPRRRHGGARTCTSGAPGCGWKAGDMLTFHQYAWGNLQSIGGTMMSANYNTVYTSTGGTLEVGIPGPSGFSMMFDVDDAVLAYLPAIGTPSALNFDLLNPHLQLFGFVRR